MLEKARQKIDKIEQNDYLTPSEAWFMQELLRLLEPLPDDDEEEVEEDDYGVSVAEGG